MDKKIDTRTICDELGVARSWVISHLRSLGEPSEIKKENKNVFYDYCKIVDYFNENAVFYVRDYPEELSERQRNLSPWIITEGKISSLKDLKTLKKYKEEKGIDYKSDEVAYRKLYLDQAIKCELHGRTWYIVG